MGDVEGDVEGPEGLGEGEGRRGGHLLGGWGVLAVGVDWMEGGWGERRRPGEAGWLDA